MDDPLRLAGKPLNTRLLLSPREEILDPSQQTG
jgi:hypothetical protein